MRGKKQMRKEKLIFNSKKNTYVGAGPVSAQINKTNTNNTGETTKNSTKWGISNGITLIALIITVVVCYVKNKKSNNNNSFLLMNN